jgi:single-strand DNA-binding protein
MSCFTINRVVLVGRLTKDPELRALPSGLSVCGLRVACNSARRDAEGDFQEKPNFFDVSVYGASAENVSRYTRKGSRIAIDGRLEWREWETAELQKREAVSVVADTVLFLDSPGEQRGASELVDGGLGDEIDQDIDQRPASELGLQRASELVGVGTRAEENDLVL